MFLTVHATAGVLIGQQTGSVWLGFLGGFISHFLLDAIPHGDQNLVKDRHHISESEKRLIRTLGLVDGVIMLGVLYAIYSKSLITQNFPVLAAVIGAIIPDYINAVYIFFKVKWLKWYFELHYKLHFIWNGFTITLRQGLIVQAIFLDILLITLWLHSQPALPTNDFQMIVETPAEITTPTQAVAAAGDPNELIFTTSVLKKLLPHEHGIGDSLTDPGHHSSLMSPITTLDKDIWASQFSLEIKNAPPSVLHHALLLTNKPDAICPNMPGTVYIAGADSPTLVNMPPPYAFYLPKEEKIGAQLMIHNPEPPLGPGGIYTDVQSDIKVKVQANQPNDKHLPVELILLRLSDNGCDYWNKTDIGPLFKVPAHSQDYVFGATDGSGPAASHYQVAKNGKIIGLGGHTHGWDYGKKIDVYLNGKLLHSFVPKKMSEDDSNWTTTPYIPAAPISIKANDILSITATYDNPTESDILDAMGIVAIYFAPDNSAVIGTVVN